MPSALTHLRDSRVTNINLQLLSIRFCRERKPPLHSLAADKTYEILFH